ncbi:hypothetical protein A3A49_02245 [Candidatus Curtissbacteria bacterium RIFCSPLOWO2_01_FULL_38_11b]|uniref:Response regulatory domain-containing protein n=1 Tax=Candidatus Curtissbacteria bacterium RIFCSPLOWO2_01_FULL_38_11b TaxID=1797725 RepID=A0A1F5GZ84_9BACT|nr:MAG: hypothetical protein A3A49_02245 [Candidatus Curtissbacteria bacterium RIFCSPLOWO2_01_FULL_38_11b]
MNTQKILLIEDDQFTRELYEEVIKDAGFAIDTATNGEEGLEKIRQGTYSLILLDIMMPKMDGIEVLRSLKNNPPNIKNGPIIILTNLTNDPVLNSAYGLNAKDYIVKSDITPGDLIDKIKVFIEQSNHSQEESENLKS